MIDQGTFHAAEIADALGNAHPDGQGRYRCDCPFCGGHNLVLSDGKKRLLVKCWNGCEQKEVLDELRRLELYGPARQANGHDDDPPETAEQRQARVAKAEREAKNKTAEALLIWKDAKPANDIMVETYLGSRQLVLPIPGTLRLARSVYRPKSQDRRPHLVGLIEHETEGPIGVNLIALNPIDAAAKATGDDRKWTKGSRAGGAVRLYPAGPIIAISEGIEDALTFAQETNIPAWAAITADGIRSFIPPPLATTQSIILIEDQDENQTGQRAVADAARRLAGLGYKIQICRPRVGKDLNDALVEFGTGEELFDLVDYDVGAATVPADADALPDGLSGETEVGEAEAKAEIARLAKLSEWRYAQERAASGKLLNVPQGMLDRLVREARRSGDADTKGQGRPLDIPAPQPWPHPVDGVALLNGLADHFAIHLTLPPYANRALALWVVHCHCFEAFEVTPRLQVKSAVKQSGKSTLIDLLKLVTPKSIEVETVSVAFIFRAIELVRPTLLLDEADRYLKDKDELIAVINAGAKRGATAGRCVGEEQEPRMFGCHAPVALAGIGTLPGTIEDRAIQIVMRRRMRSEPIQPIDDSARQTAARLLRQATRWTADHATELRDARPHMGSLFNRAADRWRALYAVAEVAGAEWPKLARETMQALAAVSDDEADSLGEQLLADIKKIFRDASPRTELAPAEVIKGLVDMPDRPWPEMGRSGCPITENRLTRLLKSFGIRQSREWDHATQKAGPRSYRLADFNEAFGRYLDA